MHSAAVQHDNVQGLRYMGCMSAWYRLQEPPTLRNSWWCRVGVQVHAIPAKVTSGWPNPHDADLPVNISL